MTNNFFSLKNIQSQMKSQHFNMIEIVLALGVIAIGLVSIMALFPVGLNASRDAIAQNYAAELAETFLTYKYVRGKENFTRITDLGSVKPDGLDPATKLETDNWGVTDNLTPTSEMTPHTGANDLWKVVQKKNNIPEFSGTLRMWRDDASYYQYDKASDSWTSANLPNTTASQIFVEISWPLERPYDRRNKEIFNLEIFNN